MRRYKRVTAVVLVGMLVALTGSATAAPANETDDANVRVAHLAPDTGNVDVFVNGIKRLDDLAFRTVTEYMDFPTGDQDVEIQDADGNQTVFNDSVSLNGTDYTLAAFGELENNTFQPQLLHDEANTTAEDTSQVRVIHASPDAPAVDIAANGTELFNNVSFTDATPYRTLDAGVYIVQVTPANATNETEPIEFPARLEGNTTYTAFATGYADRDDAPENTSFELVVTEDTFQQDVTSPIQTVNGTTDMNTTTNTTTGNQMDNTTATNQSVNTTDDTFT